MRVYQLNYEEGTDLLSYINLNKLDLKSENVLIKIRPQQIV